MGSTGPNSGSTFVDDGLLGVVAITNPTNAQVSDNAYATSILLGSQISHYLKATNFGLIVPSDARIDGILVEVERSSTVGATVVDDSVRIVQDGSILGDDKASVTAWPTSDAYATYGSATDLWGLTWTPAQVNSPTFGVAIAATTTLAATVQIDHVRITVYWTGSNRPGNIGRRVSSGGMSQGDQVS